VAPPTGTVSFLFTDLEGSTAAWERAPSAMPGLLARHDLLVRAAIDRHGGHVFATGGDGFAVAFPGAGRAVGAAVDAQRAIRAEPWPAELPMRVRMAINTGEADERDGDYFGPCVNRAARLMATANGGQVVVSERTAAFVAELPEGVVVEPRGHHLLKDLRRPELIHELVIDGADGPPLRTVRPVADSLPDIRTSFVGRTRELATLADLGEHHRLVTVVGPGGAGKTRVAIEHAARVQSGLVDGAWFVDLSTVTDGEVKHHVLTTVGLPASEEWGALRTWNALIVVDNCEHVVDAAADVVDELLEECPGVRVVATSREALAVPGEQTLPLAPMSAGVDDPQADVSPSGGGVGSDAIRLFVDRARSVDPHFSPSPAELDDVAALCAALDGLPLAIELAASRVGVSGIGDLAAELLGPPTSRRGRRRGDRHRSLRSTIQWSVDLLDDPARDVFRRLAVFEGGFTVAAATDVVSDASLAGERVREIVAALVEQSMVQARRTATGLRLSMLETVRSYALELLGDEANEVRRRHLEWAVEWSHRHGFDVDVPGWFSSTVEIANQYAALRFAIDSGDDRVAVDVFANSILSMLSAGMYDVVRPLLAELRQRPVASEPEAATRLDMCEMAIAEMFGDFETSHSLAERFRVEDDDEQRWLLGSALQIHHFAPTSPADARRVLAEFEARAKGAPMSAYLRAEIALATADFAEAVEAIFAALDAHDMAGVERRFRSGVDADPVLLADLAVGLYLTSRSDEATLAVELLADLSSSSAFSVYVPLLRAVVGGRMSTPDSWVADLRAAVTLERRWEPPLVVLDCVVLGALVAADQGHADLAAEALGATKGMPQRSISGFGIRRLLRSRLVAELGDDGWAAARERGGARSPRNAFEHLVGALAV
jgi:predicted ATPase/class 3 adenylate cyclase